LSEKQLKQKGWGMAQVTVIPSLCPGIANDLDSGPGVKRKASTKCTERTAKLSDSWDLEKELSQRMAEV
jgi:hypothetical protein